MAFKSLQENRTQSANRGRGGKFSEDEVVFATDLAGSKSETYSLRVAIHRNLAKKARLIKGDMVDVLFDEENMAGLIKRVNKGGWKLTSGSENGRLAVKVNLKPGDPTIASAAGCQCEITDEGIVFVLPDCVSFTRNVRAEADKRA